MLESRRKAGIFLVLAFLLAALAGYLVLQKVKDLNAELGGMTKIYLAKGDLPARTLIQENQLTTMEIPNKFVNSSHVVSKKDLINQVLVVPISNEQIITKNMIKPYSNLREENNRLVAMYPSEKVQFDQVIEALDRVDIIVSTKEGEKSKTDIFMRDVPVAYASTEKNKFAGVALEVSIADAPKIIHVINYADKVRVLKANVGKGDEADTQSADDQKEQAAPAQETTVPKTAPAKKPAPKSTPTPAKKEQTKKP